MHAQINGSTQCGGRNRQVETEVSQRRDKDFMAQDCSQHNQVHQYHIPSIYHQSQSHGDPQGISHYSPHKQPPLPQI